MAKTRQEKITEFLELGADILSFDKGVKLGGIENISNEDGSHTVRVVYRGVGLEKAFRNADEPQEVEVVEHIDFIVPEKTGLIRVESRMTDQALQAGLENGEGGVTAESLTFPSAKALIGFFNSKAGRLYIYDDDPCLITRVSRLAQMQAQSNVSFERRVGF